MSGAAPVKYCVTFCMPVATRSQTARARARHPPRKATTPRKLHKKTPKKRVHRTPKPPRRPRRQKSKAAGVTKQCRASLDEVHTFKLPALVKDFPPVLQDKNKRYLFGLTAGVSEAVAGEVKFYAWKQVEDWEAAAMPRRHSMTSRIQQGPFDYAASSTAMTWHVNFADRKLFHYYGGPLFAQDELQVAEHPALASLLEALLCKTGRAPHTSRVKGGQQHARPCLITGVPRVCQVDGLYGNEFAGASREELRAATSVFGAKGVRSSNIIAMEAVQGGKGAYTLGQIGSLLAAAFTAFAAAKALTRKGASCKIHTGLWGAGAYGNNKQLVTIVQLAAAQLAGVDSLTLHGITAADCSELAQGVATFRAMLPQVADAASVVQALHARRFRWGVSNGT